jgi:hypothetical protein
METIINFNVSEYEVLENIDFEEEVSRPQELRFFTLDEQLRDFFEKSLPNGKPTKYQLKELSYDRERIRKMYETYIIFGDSEYEVQNNRKSLNIPWIHPVYDEIDYKAYIFKKEYEPIFSKTTLSQPNYYSRLLKALPLPFVSNSESLINYETEVLNEEGKQPIKILMNYERTKRIIRDDGSIDIISTPIENTGDRIGLRGYYLSERPEIPRPLNDHPFLNSNKSLFYETNLPLIDIFPSTQAILEHAIPTTKDPYNDGMKILKIYDLSLKDVPWTLWKQRFPPVELKNTPKNVIQIEFPKQEIYNPSEILKKTYDFKWEIGYHNRYWLSRQIDSGKFISELLISKSSSNGLISLGPPQGPDIQHPPSTIDMCQSLTTDFDTFLHSGLYRLGKLDKEGFEINDGVCVPIGSIQQEKTSVKKIGWTETTEKDILNNYLKKLKEFKILNEEEFEKYEKVDSLEESELRKNILIILKDSLRSSEDKSNSIQLLLRDTEYKNKQYFDKSDLFVLCQHTMNILNGQLEENPQNFYIEWTSILTGKRVCKYCGEEVSSEVLVAVEEYDDSGHLIMTYESLENKKIQSETTIDSFTNSLLELKKVFDLNHPGESALFILLAFMQIIPQETQLLPILSLIRELTRGLRSKTKITKETQQRIEGIFCIPAIIIILQTHQPFLIPKRSLGKSPIKLSGFPRDSSDSTNSPILDSIISVLKTIMDEIGSTKGPINEFAKYVVSKPQKVRDESITFIKLFASKFSSLLEISKDRYSIPEDDISFNTITFPEIRIDNPIFKTGDRQQDEMLFECKGKGLINWLTKNPPYSLQIPLKLDDKIIPSPDMIILENKNVEETINNETLTQKEINEGLNLSLPSSFKFFDKFLKGSYDSSTIIKLSERVLDFVSLTKFKKDIQINLRKKLSKISYNSSSEMRDTAKSIFLIILNELKDSPNVIRVITDAIKNDIVFKMIFVSKEKAESEEFELKTKETNLLKARYREMTDTRRQLVKSLVDIGIADFIVTNEDRELFSKEFEINVEKEYDEMLKEQDLERPEEGYATRDYIENGDVPIDVMGNAMEVDFGDYGDRNVRDYDDYSGEPAFDEE